MKKHFSKYFIPSEENEFRPHAVREQSLMAVSILVVVLFGLLFSFQYVAKKNPELVATVITGVLVDLTNISRASNELASLTVNEKLTEAAQLKANDMAAKSYFAHVSPDGVNPWHWFNEVDYRFTYAGENLAVNFIDSEDVVRAWMNSEGHRRNILNDNFTEIGIALAKGTYRGHDTIYVVQLFGRPAGETAGDLVVVEEIEGDVVPVETEDDSVLGAQADTEETPVSNEDQMFIAVENTAITQQENEEEPVVLAQAEGSTSFIAKLLASPKNTLSTIYFIIGAIVLVALALFVFIRPEKQFPRYVLYTVLVLILIGVLFYATNQLLFPEILIK